MLFVMMLTGSSTTWLTKEGEICRTCHVRSSEERAEQSDDHEEVVTGISNVVDDFVLREETREWENAAQRKCGNNPRAEGDGHELTKSAHVLLHVERVVRCAVANGAGAEEQTCFKECVSEDVEYRWQPCASAKTHHHVAQLRHR